MHKARKYRAKTAGPNSLRPRLRNVDFPSVEENMHESPGEARDEDDDGDLQTGTAHEVE